MFSPCRIKCGKKKRTKKSAKVSRIVRKEGKKYLPSEESRKNVATRSLIKPQSQQDASYYSNIGRDLLVCKTVCL